MPKYFQKVWYILGDSRKQLPFLIFVFTVSSFMETLGIGMLSPFFGIVSNPDLIQENPIIQRVNTLLGIQSSQQFIFLLCALISILFILKSILYFLSKFYILRFGNFQLASMIESLNRAYLYSDYNYFLSKNSSALVKNIAYETKSFRTTILIPLLYGTSNLTVLVFLLGLMAATDLLLLIGLLTTLLPVVLLVYVMRGRLRRWGKNSSESLQKIIVTLNHGLGGFKETRVIGCEPYFEQEMQRYAHQFAQSEVLVHSFDTLPRILIETVLIVFIVSFIGISQLFLSRSIGDLISSLSVFAVASIRLLPALTQLVSVLGSLQSSKHAVDILYSDLITIEKQFGRRHSNAALNGGRLKSETQPATLSFNRRIQISHISYRYSEKLKPAIDGISLEIRRGESVAFIGKSGAGKTTLVDIILGLLTPQWGDIKVDGVSIYRNLRAWQNLVGYIPQSIFLLDDTVERNIAFGVPDDQIDSRRLQQAIAAAQLQELVAQLPQGIHTRVGERGVMLSGGQRQRIGIARALYHEREILVLDEATSALDNETEKKVSQAIQALSGKKTIILIAHRLSTVEHCDRIYLLEKGRIVKSGKYAEVVK